MQVRVDRLILKLIKQLRKYLHKFSSIAFITTTWGMSVKTQEF